MAVVALGIDASQMKAGGDQASRTLDQLQARFAEMEARNKALAAQLQGSGKEFGKAAREASQYAQAQARLSRVQGDYSGAVTILTAHLKTLSVASVEYVRVQAQIAAVQAQADRAMRGENFAGFASSLKNINTNLAGLPGQLGSVIGRAQQLEQQLGSLVTNFGLVGAGALGLAAALVSGGAAFVALSIKGAKVADELQDIQEGTGLTIDQVQRLGAAMQRSGEDVSGVERAFRQFQQTLQAATDDPTSKAATNLRRLGVVATEAGKDTGKAFIDTLAQLKTLRASTEGAAASNEVFGRGIGALVRGSNELQSILGKTRQELQETGIIASDVALGAAADLDKSMNRLSQSTNTFTVNLGAIGDGAVSKVFGRMADDQERLNGWLVRNKGDVDQFFRSVWAGFTGIPRLAIPPTSASTDPRGTGTPSRRTLILGQSPAISEPPPSARGTGGTKAEPRVELAATFGEVDKFNTKVKQGFEASARIAEAFYSLQITNFTQYTDEMIRLDKQLRSDQLSNANQIGAELAAQLAGLKASGASADSIKRVEEELSKVSQEAIELADALSVKVLPPIEKFIEQLKNFGRLTFALPSAPDIGASRSRTVGGRPRSVFDTGTAPHPDDIGAPPGTATRPRIVNEQRVEQRVQDRERINQAFSGIFEDFAFQIVTARKGLKEAFGDFALGIADVFASQFATAFQRSLQKAFIAPLTAFLEGALDQMFGGISKGIGGIFGKLLGGLFGGGGGGGGGFAMGGTIAPNSWGVVGEHGRELAFSGNQPLHIVPQGAMGGGGQSFQFNFNISAPDGQVDRRSMDQVAETVYSAVTRAQRNRGA